MPKSMLDQLFDDNYDEKKIKLALEVAHSAQKEDKSNDDKVVDESMNEIFERQSGAMRRSEYRAMKASVIEYDRIDRQYLLLYHSSDRKWLIFAGFSAMEYVYGLAPEKKRKPKIRLDSDIEDKFVEGVTFIRNFRMLVEKLESYGVTSWARVASDIWLFKLEKPLSSSEISNLREIDRRLKDQVKNSLIPERIYPSLYGMINKNYRTTFFKVRKMNHQTYDAGGRVLLDESLNLKCLYGELVNKFRDQDQVLEDMRISLSSIATMIDAMLEISGLDNDTLGILANLNVDMRTEIKAIREALRGKK